MPRTVRSVLALCLTLATASCDQDAGTNSFAGSGTSTQTSTCDGRLIASLELVVSQDRTDYLRYLITVTPRDAKGGVIVGPITVGFTGDASPPIPDGDAEGRRFAVSLDDYAAHRAWFVAVSNGCSTAFDNLAVPEDRADALGLHVAVYAEPGTEGVTVHDIVSARAAPGVFYRVPQLEVRDASGSRLTALAGDFSDGGRYVVHLRKESGRVVATTYDLSGQGEDAELVLVHTGTCGDLVRKVKVIDPLTGTPLHDVPLTAGQSVRVPFPIDLTPRGQLRVGFDIDSDDVVDAVRRRPVRLAGDPSTMGWGPGPMPVDVADSNVLFIGCDAGLGAGLAALTTWTTNAGSPFLDRWYEGTLRALAVSADGFGAHDVRPSAVPPPFTPDRVVPLALAEPTALDLALLEAGLLPPARFEAAVDADCVIAQAGLLVVLQGPAPGTNRSEVVRLDDTRHAFRLAAGAEAQWVTNHDDAASGDKNSLIGVAARGRWSWEAREDVALFGLALRCER